MRNFAFDPSFIPVAVGGGPCAGKTTFQARVMQFLEDRAFRAAFAQETATELITSGIRPWDNPGFQDCLVQMSLYREELFYRALACLESDKPKILIVDRGVLDPIAYIGEQKYLELLDELNLDLHELRERYKSVIHLVTAADGAEKFYTLENNKARTESVAEARELDLRLQEAWLGHPHLRIIDNSTDFEGKIRRALAEVARVLGIPEPLEIEKRYRVLDYDPEAIPKNAVSVAIRQDYLHSPQGLERRVRSRTINGSTSYYYTEKHRTDVAVARFETERHLRPSEYRAMLADKDPAARQVVKTRLCFFHDNRHLEFDIFAAGLKSKPTLEIELEHKDEEPLIPSWMHVEPETLSNHDIAYGKAA